MPLNVRRFCTSVLLVLSFSIFTSAQTSADVMRERVAKAKAFIAVRNYNAAIYELENIRRETKEPAVNSVVNVLLMNSYLEQSDYKRAQDFLKELSDPKKQYNPTNYFAVAGQVVKGARNQVERYKALGLMVSDRNLPLEAITDIEKMRETLEMVVEQSKVLGKDKTKTSDAMALLEEATNARTGLARDDFDANRWKNEISDAREQLANSRSVVVNAVDGTTTSTENTAAVQNTAQPNSSNTNTANPRETNSVNSVANSQTNAISNSVSTSQVDTAKTAAIIKADLKAPIETVARSENLTSPAAPKEIAKQSDEVLKTKSVNSPAPDKNTDIQKSVNNPTEARTGTQPASINSDSQNASKPLAVGSLLDYVTQKVNPIYPPAAKTVRMTGVVQVNVVIDEEGKVAEVQKTSGPAMLQRAATDAVKRWKFKPFIRDGQPTKATGFVSFNFNL